MRDDEPDLELEGELEATSKAAFLFMPDFDFSDPIWVPKSQCIWEPDIENEKRGTMKIRAWLCKKNGWG